ncbi:MAG: hypothetical protein ACTSVV_01945 [Promethearchaeota archaeon]
MRLKKLIQKIYIKIKEFFKDEYGGNIVEYALLIGFALFLFFLIVSVITSMIDWTLDQSNNFAEMMKNLEG